MTEKEFTNLKKLINENTSLIKAFKIFVINHLNTAFALSKEENNQIKNVEPHLKPFLKRKAEVSSAVILETARTITKNKN